MASDIKKKITLWATSEDYEIHTETPPKELPIDWIIRITSKAPITVNVIVQKPKNKDDQIIVSLGVMISREHYDGLMKLKESDRAELVYGIIRDLTLLCPDCMIIVQPSIVDFQRLVVTRTLYTDELTRTEFMKTVRTMVNVLALLSIRLSSKFGSLPKGQRKIDETMGFI